MLMTSVAASKETMALTAVLEMLVSSNLYLVGHGPGLDVESVNLAGMVYVTVAAAMIYERDFVVSAGATTVVSNPLSQAGSS
jgi:hypothetical protein